MTMQQPGLKGPLLWSLVLHSALFGSLAVSTIMSHRGDLWGGPGGGGASLDPSGAGTSTGLGYVSNTPDVASSNPVLGSGGPRAIQLGLKLIF